MIDKTRLGIPLFDDRYGGIYRRRAALCTGRHGSGKTIAALHFVMQCLKEGERGLILTAWHAHDLAIVAEQMRLPLSDAVEKGQVALLEYANIMPTPEFEKNLTLPPGSFMEFQEIIESNSFHRVAIDTVLPWVAIPQKEKLAKHVYSFVQAIERMGVTTLLTLPKPVSPIAFTLKNRIEEQVPIAFTLDVDAEGKHSLLVNKYLGENTLPPPVPFLIAPGEGIIRATANAPSANVRGAWGQMAEAPSAPAQPPSRSAYAPAPEPVPRPIPPPEAPPAPAGPIKFSSAFKP
jgi:KaiC/GvpD/RAD55 family RecA-like ATPase